MEKDQITNLLARITGAMPSNSAEEKSKIQELQQSLAEVLVVQEIDPDETQRFTYAQSDVILSGEVNQTRLKGIEELMSAVKGTETAAETQVVVRDTPLRNSRFTAGARISKSTGPIKDLTGGIVIVDFIKIQKLIPLYVEGNPNPAILFKASFQTPIFNPVNAKPELTKNYKVVANSVWINAHLLSNTAPEGQYCGLRVKSGTITLSELPTLLGNKLTIKAGVLANVSLSLEQKELETSADPANPYGLDARNAEFDLPQTFSFSFKGNDKTILAVDEFSVKVYGQRYDFSYVGSQALTYNGAINRIAIPVKSALTTFSIAAAASPFLQPTGVAGIKRAWWTLPTAAIDITKPLEADGNGGIALETEKGLTASLVPTDEVIRLNTPFILLEPGLLNITDLESNGAGYRHQFEAWKDAENPYGTTLEVNYLKKGLFLYNSLAEGTETFNLFADIKFKVDRPVKVNGEAVAINSKATALMLVVTTYKRNIILYDDNILWDNKLPADKIPTVKPIALAMHNALFTVTPANGAVLYGEFEEDLSKIYTGNLFLTFGLFSYLPTLPDPYAANLGVLKSQFQTGNRETNSGRVSIVWLWLVCRIQWAKHDDQPDTVGVSFHFAPLAEPFTVVKEKNPAPEAEERRSYAAKNAELLRALMKNSNVATAAASIEAQVKDGKLRDAKAGTTKSPAKQNDRLKGHETVKERTASSSPSNPIRSAFGDAGAQTMMASTQVQRGNHLRDPLNYESFSLLDVSSKANQMGVAYTGGNEHNPTFLRVLGLHSQQEPANKTGFPLQVRGLDVITAGYNARAFTVPQVAWEPLLNYSQPGPNPGWVGASYDPALGFNYYPDDGFATRIGNTSSVPVTLSPIPMAKYLQQTYQDKADGKTYAVFNLPFGMLAMTVLDNFSGQQKTPVIQNVQPIFNNYINGGIQLELTAGTSFADEDNLFQGYTVQLINVLDLYGNSTNASTLGSSVEAIFNNEWSKPAVPEAKHRPGVPLKRIGLSGYGANAFSDWHNKNAAFAETSQATFNILSGRTAHEVVQVKSVIYPWGIFVVRTITMFRLSNGYVGRIDSGWQAESDGKFYFGVKGSTNPYEIHAGVVNGLYNIRNIRENELDHTDETLIKDGTLVFDAATNTEIAQEGDVTVGVVLRGVTFDADIAIEEVVEGAGSNHLVPSKGVLGFVQLKPRGTAIEPQVFANLLKSQNNAIGAPVNCTVKIAGTAQYMKINRVDVNNAVDTSNRPIFVAAARGSVILPKEGSWSMVSHRVNDGTVTPLDPNLAVPLIRIGKWDKGKLANPSDLNNLLRIAHPTELLRQPMADTQNYGFLQNLTAQKVLFLTPSFKKGINSLLSKTPPLMADAYRLLNTKGIFPNIGNADDNIGAAIQLLKGAGGTAEAFSKVLDGGSSVLDAGKEVFEILEIKAKDEAGKLLDQGYKLIKNKADDALNELFKFDLPSFNYDLIKTDDFKIYIQYANSGSNGAHTGNLDYNVDSFATGLADQWKGRMNNLAMVIDLGPFEALMKIKGNFNTQKGAESNFGSDGLGASLPATEIEFSKAIEPVIKILEILSQLSTGDYAGALQKGLKVAMSNNANSWEYKFEATKDIPLVKFPPGPAYDAPQVPLKLEASLSLGVYFNAALKVTTDPKQLLPTAGAFFAFHGGLQVMCVTVGAGTIYAVGNVDLKLSADTSPLIALAMKFGFGAQIGVGLPVIGNVSVLFLVAIEIYVDSTKTVIVTAFMYFRGHAEICGGIVGVTITIEAKGSIEKAPDKPTYCRASVSFGLDISIFLVINISFHESWEETRQIA